VRRVAEVGLVEVVGGIRRGELVAGVEFVSFEFVLVRVEVAW